jgi:hypothetical protein
MDNYFILIYDDRTGSREKHPSAEKHHLWNDLEHLFSELNFYYPLWIAVEVYKAGELIETITRTFPK